MENKELAGLLNGMQYGDRIDPKILKLANDYGFVIIFGYSDCLMEIRGVISDEISCYGGGEVYFLGGVILNYPCEDEYPECPYVKKCQKDAVKVEAIFDAEEYTWIYKTEIPHAAFEVMEDGEKYCRGIVFKVEDIQIRL